MNSHPDDAFENLSQEQMRKLLTLHRDALRALVASNNELSALLHDHALPAWSSSINGILSLLDGEMQKVISNNSSNSLQ